jgi:HAE1 family hydrophobic/amphiphilic exporter-1
MLTLYITPVIYIYFDRIDRLLKRKLEPQLEEVPEPIPHATPERPKVVAAE